MTPSIEAAPSARARCRGCGAAIDKGELRLGEHRANPYSDKAPMTLWFHLTCGAYKRPEVLLEALEASPAAVPAADRERLEACAGRGTRHRRLPRIDGAAAAPTGRARCRSCREPIAKDSWRISLVYFDEGRFEPSGFIHAGCCRSYFETTDILGPVRHFSPDLTGEQIAALTAELG